MPAPPYKRPGMPPPKKKDLGDPGGFGKKTAPAAGAPPPDTPDPDSDNDMDMPPAMPSGGGGGVVLSLDQMGYHDEPHACALCKHFGQDGTCEVAQTQVNPDGACDVFAAQDQGASAGQGDMQQAPMSAGMPMGGAPSGGAQSGLPS